MGPCLSKPDKAVLDNQGQKDSQSTEFVPENGRVEPTHQQAPAQPAEQHMVEQLPAEKHLVEQPPAEQQQQLQQSEPEQPIEAEFKGAVEGGKAPATPEQVTTSCSTSKSVPHLT